MNLSTPFNLFGYPFTASIVNGVADIRVKAQVSSGGDLPFYTYGPEIATAALVALFGAFEMDEPDAIIPFVLDNSPSRIDVKRMIVYNPKSAVTRITTMPFPWIVQVGFAFAQYVSTFSPPTVDPWWDEVVLEIDGRGLVDQRGLHTLQVFDGAPTVDGTYFDLNGASSFVINDGLSLFEMAGDWTLDGIALQNSTGQPAINTILLSNYVPGKNGTLEVYLGPSPGYSLNLYREGSGVVGGADGPLAADAPVPYAIQRRGNNFDVYMGTTLRATSGLTSGMVQGSPFSSMFVGRESAGASKYVKGKFRLRLTNGVARYSGGTFVLDPWQ